MRGACSGSWSSPGERLLHACRRRPADALGRLAGARLRGPGSAVDVRDRGTGRVGRRSHASERGDGRAGVHVARHRARLRSGDRSIRIPGDRPAVTLPVVLVAPLLYAYPKLDCYPLAVWAMWRYLDKPTLVCWCAAVTAVAFLFRHDHGVYIGTAIAAMLVARHWPRGDLRWSRVVGAYALVGAVPVSTPGVRADSRRVDFLRATGVEFSRAVDRDLIWPQWAPSPPVRSWQRSRFGGRRSLPGMTWRGGGAALRLVESGDLAGTTWHYDREIFRAPSSAPSSLIPP